MQLTPAQAQAVRDGGPLGRHCAKRALTAVVGGRNLDDAAVAAPVAEAVSGGPGARMAFAKHCLGVTADLLHDPDGGVMRGPVLPLEMALAMPRAVTVCTKAALDLHDDTEAEVAELWEAAAQGGHVLPLAALWFAAGQLTPPVEVACPACGAGDAWSMVRTTQDELAMPCPSCGGHYLVAPDGSTRALTAEDQDAMRRQAIVAIAKSGQGMVMRCDQAHCDVAYFTAPGLRADVVSAAMIWHGAHHHPFTYRGGPGMPRTAAEVVGRICAQFPDVSLPDAHAELVEAYAIACPHLPADEALDGPPAR